MADVSIDASVSTATARGSRCLVFPTPDIGYVFYIDSDGRFGYAKTTDGGATWGAQVDIDADTFVVAFDVWFDQWTPGDAGTLIHCWWFDSSADDVFYRTLNLTGDTLGTRRDVFVGASAIAGRGAFVSGTKTRSGYLYCCYDIDAGAERGLVRSTNDGTVWSANLATTFLEATLDTAKLFPATGTGDNNDCWALYYDASATALTIKLWDSSAAAQVESATFQTHTDGATDLTGQFGYDGTIRHSDGHLLVAAQSTRDVAAGTHQVFDVTSTASIATKTAIAASTDDHYFPQIFINQGTGTIFVAYVGKRDGSEVLDTTAKVYYTYSFDGGTTWQAGDTAYMEGAAGAVQQVWCPITGQRFYCLWRVGTTLVGNKVNSLIQLTAQAPTITAGSVVQAPTLVYPQDILGATIGGGVALPDMEAYWPLNEGTGTTSVDASGHGHTLTRDSSHWTTTTHKFGAAALEGDDTNNYWAHCTEINLLNVHSVAFWINGWDGSNDGMVLAGTDAYQVYLDATQIYYNTSLAGANYVTVSHGGLTGSRHVVVTRSSATVRFYVDGVLRGTAQTLPGSATTPSRLRVLGARLDGEFAFVGTVDDVRVYLVALTADEVATLYALNPDLPVGGAATVTPPGVALGGVGDQTVTGATIPTGSSAAAPTAVVPQAVTVSGATRATTVQMFALTVAVEAVTITGATIAAADQRFTPTVTPGVVAVTGATVTAGTLVHAPVVVPLVSGITISSGSAAFPPSLTLTVTTATIPATSQPFGPSVAEAGVGAVGAGTVTSTILVRAPTVTAGPVTVLAATRVATSQTFTPTVSAPTSTAVGGGTIAPTSQRFSPSVTLGAVTVTTGPRPSTAQLFTLTVAPGAVTVLLATRVSTLTLVGPSLGAALTLPTVGSSVATWPPSVVAVPPPLGAQVSVAFMDAGLVAAAGWHTVGLVANLTVTDAGLEARSTVTDAGLLVGIGGS